MKKYIAFVSLVLLASCTASNSLYRNAPSSRQVNKQIKRDAWKYTMPAMKHYDTYTLYNQTNNYAESKKDH